MFQELMPLIRERAVMITVSHLGDEVLRVNVIPKKLDKTGDGNDNSALTAPLSITGTPEELDRHLAAQLAGFTESVVKTASNLAEVRTQHVAAVKAIEAENKKSLDQKKLHNAKKVSGSEPPKQPPSGPEVKDGKPVFGTKPAPAAKATSLFDSPQESEMDRSGASAPAVQNPYPD